MTSASDQIGTTLGGKYQLTALLGEGGMGRVFAARHRVIGRKVVHARDGDIHASPSGGSGVKISLWILYCTLFLTFLGATPGKLLFGLRVVSRDEPGERPSLTAALLRSAFFIISAFAAGLGCLWALFDGERRTWHDRIAATRVVRVDRRTPSSG